MKMSKCIFRAIIAIIILLVVAGQGYAQVNRDELEDLPPVVFINYEGPHARLDTREQIRQIGVGLGQQIAERERGIQPTLEGMTLEQRRSHSYRFEAGTNNRYYVIHSISGPEENKLNADIMILGVDVAVDHVRNLRVIIQGYLQEAYNYSASDALLLAEFITVYNAVYRGNWDYFVNRYKTPVVDSITRDRAGLSIRYDEWPGRTQLLIPLGTGRGLSSIDTSTITDGRVIEEMRREDDLGVPQRQQMVDLIERQAEQTERQVQAERQAIRQEERAIASERRQTEQERQRLREAQEAGTISEQRAREVQTEIIVREEDLSRREIVLEERRDEADRTQELAEQRTEEAQRQREEIARDQQAIIVQEERGGVIGVTIERQNPAMGRLVMLDQTTAREIRRSPLDLIHSRTVTFVGGRLIAIAGENRRAGAVRLIEINQTTLEMVKQGDDDIRAGSLLWVNGTDLYAITIDLRNNQCFIGRFDTNLILQAKSAVRIHPESSVTIQQGRLLTQRENGSALILNPMDLTEIR